MTGRVLVVQHQDDCPPAWVGDWLVEAGCELDVSRPYAGEALPDDLHEHDALLVLGGSMNANDDEKHPWLGPTKDLLRQAAAHGVPALGICLGWTDAAAEDALTAGLDPGFGVHWNDDVVLRSPEGTVVLALAPGGELQVARFAPTVWGVQLHPEVDEAILAAWAEDDRDRYDEGVLEGVLRRIADARAELVAGWRPLALAFTSLA
jgi:GMP synthase (glutamine-hydrolysing)